MIIAKIVSYDRSHNPQLTVNDSGLGKITGGQLSKITPTKIPRLIGKKGSMISLIKRDADCEVIIGHNGLISIKGKNLENEKIVIKTINMIEKEAHTSGLTDRVAQFIKEEKEKIKNVEKT